MTEILQEKIASGGLLTLDKILPVTGETDKKTLIFRLVQTACRGLARVDVAEAAAQVLKREEGLGTALETGLAIPHARLEELDDFAAAAAILYRPLADEKHPQKPTKVMFLFLSPDNPSFFKRHLQLLSFLAETFQPALVEELAGEQNPARVAEILARVNMVK